MCLNNNYDKDDAIHMVMFSDSKGGGCETNHIIVYHMLVHCLSVLSLD